jgi:hypothetical protein
MRKTRIFIGLLSAGLLVVGYTQSSNEVVDRLHGFKVRLPEGWAISTSSGLPLFYKEHCYVMVGATTYKGNLKEVAQQLMRDLRQIQRGEPKLAFRAIPQGVQIVGEGLDYPYALNPEVVFDPSPKPQRFNFVGLLLKGKQVVLSVLFFFPEATPESTRKEMVEVVRSLEFLPASQRVKWKPVTIRDPMMGMDIGTIHVPEGYEVEGGPLYHRDQYLHRYEVKQGNFFCRLDYVDLKCKTHSSAFGVDASTTLIYNGRDTTFPVAAQVNDPKDVEELLRAIWQAETDREWSIKERRVRETKAPDVGIPMPMPTQRRSWAIDLLAESGELVRYASANVRVSSSVDASYTSATSYHSVGMMMLVAQLPKQKLEALIGIAAGIRTSVRLNPKWVLAALEEFTRIQKELNRMVLGMLRDQREFNSQMARAWSNALSDQTYIRDPESGEVFKVYKRVWDTDNFWRDPVFGNIIGTIGKETKLGELLREKGWKVLDESLSGVFP